jgi:ferredoxin-NADP reductase
VHGDQIVEIESEGPWDQLGAVLERLLDGGVITDAELAAFEASGDFAADHQVPDRDQAEIVCRCARVTAGDVVAMIVGGCDTLDELAAKSMATRVCGGCVPVIKEFFGQGEWMPAVCDATQTVAPDIRMFRLRLLDGECSPSIPGQHLVIQARIGGRWIERPYTISSPPRTPRYEVIVKREPLGLLSRWLFDSMDGGSALRVSPPRGNYRLDPTKTEDVVILAGGIGITPGLAMARAYAAVPRTWHLHIDHSVSHEEQAICDQELSDLAAESAGLTFNLRVTRRDGRLNAAALEPLNTAYPEACYYLCGDRRTGAGQRPARDQPEHPDRRHEPPDDPHARIPAIPRLGQTDRRAAQTRCGEAGRSMWRTPRCATASMIAFCTAGVAPIVPASPRPLAPSGLRGVGVWLSASSKLGSSAAVTKQ